MSRAASEERGRMEGGLKQESDQGRKGWDGRTGGDEAAEVQRGMKENYFHCIIR